MGAGRDEPAVEGEGQQSQQHIQYAFPVDADGPEQGGGKQENGECRRGSVRKTSAEDPEEGDIPKKYRKGEQECIDVEVVPGKYVEEHIDTDDPVVGDIGKGRIVFHELGEIGQQAGTVHKAQLVELPWVAVSGVVAKGYPVVQDACTYVQCEEQQNKDWSDPAVADKGDLQQSVYDQETIAYKQ